MLKALIISKVNSKALQAAGAGEGCRVGIGATEAAVEVHRLVAATLFEDVVAE